MSNFPPSGNQEMVSQAKGLNQNMGALIQAIQNAFVGNASQGSFTMAAGATQAIPEPRVTATSIIIPAPRNAAAAGLNAFVSAINPGSSFTISLSGANAAGGEQFDYLLVNVG